MLLKKGFAFYYLVKDNLLEEPFSFFIKLKFPKQFRIGK